MNEKIISKTLDKSAETAYNYCINNQNAQAGETEMKKVFIDGQSGTTGLGIFKRLEKRKDLCMVTLPDALRKDPASRKKMLNECDAAILCLPDDAAREAVSMVENPDVIILDASTAHRTQPGWVYGLPELDAAQEQAIRHAKRIAVPGCHASGFIALVRPLIKNGFIADTARLVCHSLTGYSGGGKKMIAQYEAQARDSLLDAPRQYGISQQHKHLKEMTYITGLATPPVFCPIVADFYSGMEVTVALFAEDLAPGISMDTVRALYEKTYCTGRVRYCGDEQEEGFLSANALHASDEMHIGVYGNAARMLLVARYDNLGKGASGAAVQCLELALGLDGE